MLIDRDDVGESPREETGDQVLADESCGSSDYGLLGHSVFRALIEARLDRF
jgi:hypothetical protein